MMAIPTYQKVITKFEIIDSIIGIVGIAIILGSSLIIQFFYHEQPCPLCLLQRAAFLNIGVALMLNVKFGNRVSHWALVIFSAVAGIAVSIRQILLHVNDPIGFGSAVLSLHMYTWCFIGFAIAIIGSGIMLIIYPENNGSKN